ncbi:MAG: hypothetical protein A2096_04360 [Spirochaetes bacterium GWF1_41_5]|nr:MAG: hypothetical protein A2096_04360 [Spirochaetes bacterium GWF1_41_5]HBE04271.1 hypothetical protein [Spirochaetia bacterium]
MSLKKIIIHTVISIGLLSPAWYGDWKYRKVITNNLAVNGNLTNFPMLLIISNDSDLSAKASNNGHDILFTLQNGYTKLAHEIEYYCEGTIIAWIKMPVLSASESDSNITYMYFGGESAGNQANAAAVWSEYAGIYHLSDLNDSSGSVNNLSTSGPAYNAAGLIHGNYSAAGSGYLSCAALDGSGFPRPAGTFSMWVKGNFSAQNTASCILDTYDNTRSHYYIRCNSGAFLQFAFATNGGGVNLNIGMSNNSWNYVVLSYSSSTLNLYSNNGFSLLTYPHSPAMEPSNQYFGLGYNFTGYLDEARISPIMRSSNWIMTEYSNQSAPLLFRKPPGVTEVFSGVLFTSFSPAVSPCAVGENAEVSLNARVLIGTITSVVISWGDGQNSIYTPGMTNISAESFGHVYNVFSNYTATATINSSTGASATNHTVIAALPYRIYSPHSIVFSNESRGCLVKWKSVSSANITHFNLYRGNNLHSRIENPALYEYLDERIVYGDRYSYWIEAVYGLGSAFSVTNISDSHAVAFRQVSLGVSGGSLATLLAELFIPQYALAGTCTISMTVLSNRYVSFYDSGKPVYHQVEITGADLKNQLKGPLRLRFRIPAVNGALSFHPSAASGYTIAAHKDSFFCASWNGKTWTQLSTLQYENRRENNFSFLELETTVSTPGVFGVMYNALGYSEEKVVVKNRLFSPHSCNTAHTAVQIGFPNPDRGSVRIQIADINGKKIREDGFEEWINFWIWDGFDNTGRTASTGLYIISIIVSGRNTEIYKIHSFLQNN